MEGVRIFDKQARSGIGPVTGHLRACRIERTEVPAGSKVFRLVGYWNEARVTVVGVSDAASKPLQGVRVVPNGPCTGPARCPRRKRCMPRASLRGLMSTAASLWLGKGITIHNQRGVSSLWMPMSGPSDPDSGLACGRHAHRHLDVYFSCMRGRPALRAPEESEPPALSELTAEKGNWS